MGKYSEKEQHCKVNKILLVQFGVPAKKWRMLVPRYLITKLHHYLSWSIYCYFFHKNVYSETLYSILLFMTRKLLCHENSKIIIITKQIKRDNTRMIYGLTSNFIWETILNWMLNLSQFFYPGFQILIWVLCLFLQNYVGFRKF